MSDRDDLRRLMQVLKENHNSATFFVTGSYYEQNQDLVHEMLDNGFEVGYHSHTHCKLDSKEILTKELEQSRSFLETLKPKGFRAPWIYLPRSLLDLLPQWGFAYDSSTFGYPGSHYHCSGLDVFPVSSIRYFGKGKSARYPKKADLSMLIREIPIGSGIFVSLLRKLYPWILNSYASRNQPFVLYIHNWQLSTPPKKFKLWRDRLRYVHRFPLLDVLVQWSEKLKFKDLVSRLSNSKDSCGHRFSHYLTVDVEVIR